MMTSNTIPPSMLRRLLDENPAGWNVGPVCGDEEQTVRWIKVTVLPSANVTLGLSDTGYWVRGDGATIGIGKAPEPISLLPCLECSLEELRNALSSGLSRVGLPPELERTFPLSLLVACGLGSGSEYWVRLALDRVEQGILTEEIRDTLRIVLASAPTQKLRHRASAILAKIEKPE